MATGKVIRSRTHSFVEVKDETPGERPDGRAYRCEVWVSSEGGRFKAVPITLPSAPVGHGGSENEAMAAVTGGLATAITAHLKGSGQIPWVKPAEDPPEGVEVRWVFARV